MYEHVICINPLNLTLRSSTPDFITRLGFEGTLNSEFARSQGGRRGSDPDPSPVLRPGNIPH